MGKKGQNYKPLNESEYTDIEINGFTDCESLDDSIEIKAFSFSDQDDNSMDNTQNIIKSFEYTKSNSTNTKDNHRSENKETSSLAQIQKVRGLTPTVNGESFDIKRCYQFRASTLKKLNQIKGESDNINIYLNEIIDAAICFYHDSIFNKN
ncbi:hypothetical protein [Clostridium beijerinckii]|uniref:hypothetical protein n=1 Tax=Clostridium beijerinckii TaxID=1520 RepID=UPI001361C85C|nr:hypothetical protein [Clostridium beijerinckii]MZK52138.1 hypothetical protein [Clostridium beijerinckii]MZK61702.1 hypothetical protein [Clostridium beijerinckii]MZK71484.1 hypothetical protein [Clostridium beijerinckii]MZK76843.1 hypothetical protein [Clostridium beijerinckii]MZK85531.1 hypothetical protein [Clostridium beijerinckii]